MSFTFLGIFGAGLLTFLSPCVLPLAPIIIASLILSPTSSRLSRVISTAWFSLGFTLVFILMGLSVPGLSSLLGSLKPYLLGLAGVVLILFGLKMMQALNFGWLNRGAGFKTNFLDKLPRGSGLHGLLFGAIFGLSWTPCVGPVLGGVLTYIASQETTPLESALKLLPFALGISLPLLILAAASEQLLPLLNRVKKHLQKIEYAIGLGLFIFGVFILNQARLQAPFLSGQRFDANQSLAVTAVTHTGERVTINAEAKNIIRMLFFYSDTCPICHAMEAYLPEFEASCVNDQFKFYRINVNTLENLNVTQLFNVKAVPTVSILNEQGQEIIHLVGYQTEGRLREAAKLSEKICRKPEIPQFQTPPEATSCQGDQTCPTTK